MRFAASSIPADIRGVPIDPAEWNRQDGYRPGTPILVYVPGLDAATTDIGRSLAPDAPIVLLRHRHRSAHAILGRVQGQKATFLLTGTIIDVCAEAPCP